MKKRRNGIAPGAATIRLRPRYYRLFTDPGVAEAEENFRYAELEWDVPLSEAALICLDVWNYHFSRDTLERVDRITRERIAPLVKACREHGLQVIHAPAPPVAQKHPHWVRMVESPPPPKLGGDDWPPRDFRAASGVYAKYARPHEAQTAGRERDRDTKRDFHPLVRPEGCEAVILNGEELHRLCAQRKILHLIYVGFNTNACIIRRDYGTFAMLDRGFNIILIRDCTTGIETHETRGEEVCTRGVIATLEQFGVYTMTAAQLTHALSAVTA